VANHCPSGVEASEAGTRVLKLDEKLFVPTRSPVIPEVRFSATVLFVVASAT
jgi:hypothetical protein